MYEKKLEALARLIQYKQLDFELLYKRKNFKKIITSDKDFDWAKNKIRQAEYVNLVNDKIILDFDTLIINI